MIKALVLSLCVLASNANADTERVFDHKPTVLALEHDLQFASKVDLAKRTERAIDALLKVADSKLREEGRAEEANQLTREWAGFQGYLATAVMLENLGDHNPLSQWLAEKYDMLLALLGPTVMEFLHLDDIKTFNYGITVVFHMKQIGEDPIDLAEYELHFDPFCGVLAYWGTWIACEIMTDGIGSFLICTPAGMLAEYVTFNYVAPRFAPSVFERFY